MLRLWISPVSKQYIWTMHRQIELNWNHFSVSLMFGWNYEWPPVGEFWDSMSCLSNSSNKAKNWKQAHTLWQCGFILFNHENISSIFFPSNREFGKRIQQIYNICFPYLFLNGRLWKIISNHSDSESNSPPLYIKELPENKQTKKKGTRASDRGEVRVHINVDLDKRCFLCVSPLMHAQMSPWRHTQTLNKPRFPSANVHAHDTGLEIRLTGGNCGLYYSKRCSPCVNHSKLHPDGRLKLAE